jgi:uncharacterized membrane-anchored protein YitT (DUF2179 family)
MNSISRQITTESVKKFNKKQNLSADKKLFNRQLKHRKIEISGLLQDIFLILIGIFSAGFGLKGFLFPNSFIDGGVTGISLIVAETTNISLALLIVLINAPFILIGFSTISKQFAVKSIIAIIGLAIVILVVPYPEITNDKLLVSVFGGFFLGLGIGMSIRGGAVIDGTEVLAVFISKKTPASIGDIILVFNIMIFSVASYVFSVEIALYAILTYISASKTVDFVVSGIEEYHGVTIISENSEEIRLAIVENLGRGCTIYSGKKGYAKRNQELKPIDIVYTVVTRLELSKLQLEIEKIDSDAFYIMDSIKDAKGGMIKKRPLEK